MNLHCHIFLKLPMGRKTSLSIFCTTQPRPACPKQRAGRKSRRQSCTSRWAPICCMWSPVTWRFCTLADGSWNQLIGTKPWHLFCAPPKKKNGGDIDIISYSSIYILHICAIQYPCLHAGHQLSSKLSLSVPFYWRDAKASRLPNRPNRRNHQATC